MHSTIQADAQAWRQYNNESPLKIDFPFSKETTSTLSSWPDMKEIALDFDISANKNIATAWVPYEFYIEGNFSHCGVDVFTLFKNDDEWKIITLTYTIEKVNCDQISRK